MEAGSTNISKAGQVSLGDANSRGHIKPFIIISGIMLILLMISYVFMGRSHEGIDDANIFFTYAKNLANGHGFVYNAGDERVEGFTSMLWVLICGLAYRFFGNPEMVLLVFSFIISCFTVYLVYNELRKDTSLLDKRFAEKYLPFFAFLFIAAVGLGFIVWSALSLMENVIWNFFFISLVVITLNANKRGSISGSHKLFFVLLLVLLLVTRPEGLMWGVFFIILNGFILWKNRRSVLFPLLALVIFAGAAAALIQFRISYFGYPFPNTYYAKVSGSLFFNIIEGLRYMISFVTDYNPLVSLLLAALLCFSLRLNFLRRKALPPGMSTAAVDVLKDELFLVTLIIVIGLMLPLLTGGDHFGAYRFYQGIVLLFAWGIPAIVWICKEGFSRSKAGVRYVFVCSGIFIALVSFNALYTLNYATNAQLKLGFDIAKEGRELAAYCNQVSWEDSSKPSVGIIRVGGFGLVYEGKTIDLMGLNNTIMGHSKNDRKGIKNHAAFDKAVFYQMKADVLSPLLAADQKAAFGYYEALLSQSNFDNQAMKDIFNDAEFKAEYKPVFIKGQNGERGLFVFVQQDYLKKIAPAKNISLLEVNLSAKPVL